MPTDLTCSFCGKHEREVERLACERRDRICNECLVLCADIIAEDTARSKPAPPGRDLRCSFCDQSEHDARKLIAGPTVFICDGCVVRLAAA